MIALTAETRLVILARIMGSTTSLLPTGSSIALSAFAAIKRCTVEIT